MISLNMLTPYETMIEVAKRARGKRLELNLTQESLSNRSGVSVGTIKKFERSGKISFESILKLALILNVLDDFNQLFHPQKQTEESLDQVLKKKTRKRGRK